MNFRILPFHWEQQGCRCPCTQGCPRADERPQGIPQGFCRGFKV